MMCVINNDQLLNRESSLDEACLSITHFSKFTKYFLEQSSDKNKRELEEIKEYYSTKTPLGSLEDFFNSWLLLWKKLEEGNGIIEIDSTNGNEENVHKLLKLISISTTEINDKYQKYKKELKNSLIYSENPLFQYPIIFEERLDREIFICPSPVLFLMSMMWLPAKLVIQNSALKNCTNLTNKLLGDALENYVGDTINFYKDQEKSEILNYKLINESEEGKNNGNKKADFIIETEGYIFIIELKSNFGLYNSSSNPEVLFDQWDKQIEALQQCSSSRDKIDNPERKKIVCLAIVNENMCAEALIPLLIYDTYLKREEGTNTGFGNYCIIPLMRFFKIIDSQSLESFAQYIEGLPEEELSESDPINEFMKITGRGFKFNEDQVKGSVAKKD